MRPHHLADLRDRVGVAGRRLGVHEGHEVDLRVLGQGVADLLGGDGRVEGHGEVVHGRAAVAQPVAEGLPVGPRDDVQRDGAGARGGADRALQRQQRLALHDHHVLPGAEQARDTVLDRGETCGAQRGEIQEGMGHGGALFGDDGCAARVRGVRSRE
ncbi:hypothetical protein RKD37_006773 [Streptomyces ambofaciens]